MEGKKLNFSAPLLSVRRVSSPRITSEREIEKMKRSLPPIRQHSLPPYKQDSRQVQGTEPVTVPFRWEQSPGRPKGHSGPLSGSRKITSAVSHLPANRFLDFLPEPVEKESKDQYALVPLREASKLNDSVTIWESLKERAKRDSHSDIESCDEDAYSDARDTLSLGESCSWSCSVSGLSGSDGPDVKPSGTFSSDPQTRDFMMKRFLPAAKAMTLETPHYAPKKQPMAPEPPSQVRKEIHMEKRPSLPQYGSSATKPCYQGVGEEESEDEDENESNDDSRNTLIKACGLVPRFSLKNSLCLLNPVPGMKAKAHDQKAANIRQKKVDKVDKRTWSMDLKHKLNHAKSLEQDGLQPKLSSKSHQLNYCSDLMPASTRSSPHRQSRDAGISPYRNQASRSSFQARGFLGLPQKAENLVNDRLNLYGEGFNNSEEKMFRGKSKSGSGSGSPAVEKTLYIDSVNIVKSRHSCSSASDTRGMTCFGEKDFEVLEERNNTKKETLISEMIRHMESLNPVEGMPVLKVKSNVSGPLEAHLFPSFNLSHPADHTDSMDWRPDQCLKQDFKSSKCSEDPYSNNTLISNEQIIGAEGNSIVSSLMSPLAPPLPKSPSESWLWRTLPSASKRPCSPYSGRPSNLRKQAPVKSSSDTKWETIVKISNLRKDHVRYSEELITNVSQQSKT